MIIIPHGLYIQFENFTSRSYQLVQQGIRNDDFNQFASSITFTYIATSFTSSVTFDCRKIVVDMAKTGSPVSIISQKIYDSGVDGLPANVLYTSTTQLSASSVETILPITSSYSFDYTGGTNIVSESIYHIVTYVASNTTGSYPAAALGIGIAYNDTPGEKISRSTDGGVFTQIYHNTQIGHKLYTYQ